MQINTHNVRLWHRVLSFGVKEYDRFIVRRLHSFDAFNALLRVQANNLLIFLKTTHI